MPGNSPGMRNADCDYYMSGRFISMSRSMIALTLAVTELRDKKFMVCFQGVLILWPMEITKHKFPPTQLPSLPTEVQSTVWRSLAGGS